MEIKKLREFIYLDDLSINSHLSSLGKGIPNEVVHESTDQSETTGSGGGDVSLPGIGGIKGSVEGRSLDQDVFTKRLQITAPYRFQQLIRLWEEQSIPIKSIDSGDLERGDPCYVKGKLKPMSLFKGEVLTHMFIQIVGEEEPQSALERVTDEETQEDDFDTDNIEQIEDAHKVVSNFLGPFKPVRMQLGLNSIGIPLKQDHLRVNSYSPFIQDQEYSVVGRIQKVLKEDPGSESIWDPAEITTLMREFMGDDQADELIENFVEGFTSGEGIDVTFSEADKRISAPGYVVYPIALFW